jgi:cobalt-precorrin 5A hydrolase
MTSQPVTDTFNIFIAGFGFRQSATSHSFSSLLARTGYGNRIDKIAVPADKAGHPEFIRFCAETGVEIIPIDRHQIAHIQTPSQSEASQHYRQTGSVCEAVALCAAGENSVIISHRLISDDRLASCAISAPSVEPQHNKIESRR